MTERSDTRTDRWVLEAVRAASQRRKLCQAAGFQLDSEIAHRFGDLDAGAWDTAVAGASLLMQAGYLQATESSGPRWYVLFRQRSQPVGAAVFHRSRFRGPGLASLEEKPRPWLGWLSKRSGLDQATVEAELLVCGDDFVTGAHGFCFQPGAAAKPAMRSLSHTASAIQKAMGERTVGVLIKDFHAPAPAPATCLTGLGYVALPTEADLILALDPRWRCFEDYLASLASKGRIKAKRAMTRSAGLLVRDLHGPDVLRLAPRMAQLYAAILERAPTQLGEFDPHLYAPLQQRLSDKLVLKGYFADQHLVGFMAGFVDGASLVAQLVGLDYEQNRRHGIYPRILYDYLRVAFERGLARVQFGRTCGEIKSSLGAEPVGVTCYLRHQHFAANALMRHLSPRLQGEPFAVRRPFKQQWYRNNGAG